MTTFDTANDHALAQTLEAVDARCASIEWPPGVEATEADLHNVHEQHALSALNCKKRASGSSFVEQCFVSKNNYQPVLMATLPEPGLGVNALMVAIPVSGSRESRITRISYCDEQIKDFNVMASVMRVILLHRKMVDKIDKNAYLTSMIKLCRLATSQKGEIGATTNKKPADIKVVYIMRVGANDLESDAEERDILQIVNANARAHKDGGRGLVEAVSSSCSGLFLASALCKKIGAFADSEQAVLAGAAGIKSSTAQLPQMPQSHKSSTKNSRKRPRSSLSSSMSRSDAEDNSSSNESSNVDSESDSDMQESTEATDSSESVKSVDSCSDSCSDSESVDDLPKKQVSRKLETACSSENNSPTPRTACGAAPAPAASERVPETKLCHSAANSTSTTAAIRQTSDAAAAVPALASQGLGRNMPQTVRAGIATRWEMATSVLKCSMQSVPAAQREQFAKALKSTDEKFLALAGDGRKTGPSVVQDAFHAVVDIVMHAGMALQASSSSAVFQFNDADSNRAMVRCMRRVAEQQKQVQEINSALSSVLNSTRTMERALQQDIAESKEFAIKAALETTSKNATENKS